MMLRWLGLLAILATAGTPKALAQKPTFSVSAEEVRIDVLATDKGKPISGLRAADFEVLDNGVRQEVRYVALQKQIPVSAILVFDMSSSVGGDLLNPLKAAAGAFLSDLGSEDHAALITFGNAVALAMPPSRDLASVRRALEGTRPSGNSSLIDGSFAALVLSESRPDPPLIIIFSDGRDTFSWLTSDVVMETAKRIDAVVYAASPDRHSDKTFLKDLTRLTGGSLFEIDSAKKFDAVFLGILDEFRQRYVLTYVPRGVSESGWHAVDVRVNHRSAKIRARPGYMRVPSGQ